MIVQLDLGLALHSDDFLQQCRTEAATPWLLYPRPAIFKPIQIEDSFGLRIAYRPPDFKTAVRADNAPYLDELDASS